MQGKLARANAIVFAVGAVWRAFDEAFRSARWSHAAAPTDSLLYYNMLLGWWRHGDSPLGLTLTPSPYFIDLVMQLPIALLAPDFERFAYALALVYALLIFAALAAVLTAVFDTSGTLAALTAGATVVGFYTLAPFDLILHSFITNHTSEVFAALGLVAVLDAMFTPGAPRRRYAPVLYATAVAACVASSPFFIATYCTPAAVAAASVIGTRHVTWRRLGWFVGLTILGSLAGMIALAITSQYLWPVRHDNYNQTFWLAFKTFTLVLGADPRLWHLALVAMIGATASGAFAVVGRLRRWPVPLRFVLAYYPVSVASCVLLPLRRGMLFGGYELRYFQLPWLLTAAFYAGVAAWSTRAIARRLPWRPALPRWSRWSAGALTPGGIALVAMANGPLTVDAPASTTSAAIRCFADAERSAGLQDGIAGVWMARYLNAARLGSAWRSSHVLVQVAPYLYPAIDPHENNLVWFDGAYRGGGARLNFFVTHGFPDAVVTGWRDRLGAPDRVITCPSPIDVRPDNKPTFEIWVWDRDEPQRKLVEIVTRDNLRSPFAPVVGASEMVIDVEWGMATGSSDGELVAGRRVWRRADHRAGGALATTHPMYVPGGRYRLEIELSAASTSANAEPVAEVVVRVEGRRRVQRFPISAGTRRAVLEIQVKNPGGATTSGNAMTIAILPRAAESLELSAMKLTLIALDTIAPFEIFR